MIFNTVITVPYLHRYCIFLAENKKHSVARSKINNIERKILRKRQEAIKTSQLAKTRKCTYVPTP